MRLPCFDFVEIIEWGYKYLCAHIPNEKTMNTACWNIAVPPDINQSARVFIAARGGFRRGGLSRLALTLPSIFRRGGSA
jgi:hypothetical protein